MDQNVLISPTEQTTPRGCLETSFMVRQILRTNIEVERCNTLAKWLYLSLAVNNELKCKNSVNIVYHSKPTINSAMVENYMIRNVVMQSMKNMQQLP
ncbi:hypothetical protein Hdeb2414_s0018g00525101 [Helianthus debilis subsp. tardiflorus]